MDETLVYTRRPTKPNHSNYITATVNISIYALV